MSSSRTETLVDVTMPQMGVSVAEGTIIAWRVGVGDPIAADETICEISTDKIDTEVPAPVSGVVAEILVEVETTVEVGTVLARIATGDGGTGPGNGASGGADAGGGAVSRGSAVSRGGADATEEPGADAAAEAATSASPAPPSASPSTPSKADAPEAGVKTARHPTTSARNGAQGDGAAERPRYSPVVQRIAAEHGIDLSQIQGTGRGGRVRKQDVLAYIESAPEPPLHIESPYRPEPVPEPVPAAAVGSSGELSRMRRQIGVHMKRSLETTATCTTWIEVDMGRVEAARGALRLTALSFVARATIVALREHPALNAWMEGERYSQHDGVNLGIAVSLGDDGLIVPVIHSAHELSVEGLAARIKDLARRARARELTPDEVRGGTFTITNPGQYGSIMATPIINLPQVAILDLEAVVKRPVVLTDADGDDSIAIRPMTILGLSWDHRALDGALAAQFLATLKRLLEGWTGT